VHAARLFVFFLIVVALLGHIQISKNLASELGERTLIFEGSDKTSKIAPGARLNVVAPKIDDMDGSRRRSFASQPFANKQRQGIFERRVGALAHLGKPTAFIVVFQRGREILRGSQHPAGANRFYARLL